LSSATIVRNSLGATSLRPEICRGRGNF